MAELAFDAIALGKCDLEAAEQTAHTVQRYGGGRRAARLLHRSPLGARIAHLRERFAGQQHYPDGITRPAPVPAHFPDVPLPLRLYGPHLDVGIVVPGDGMPLAIRIRLDPQDPGVSRCEPARICIEPTRCHSVAAAREREKLPLDSLRRLAGVGTGQDVLRLPGVGRERGHRVWRAPPSHPPELARERAELPSQYSRGLGTVQGRSSFVVLDGILGSGCDVLHVSVRQTDDGDAVGGEAVGPRPVLNGAPYR